ncbi:SDR family NAD(P)-dependent oxidoreductase [Nocardioides zeae]|uniref:SDR family NAD(P)-dependent oxidoreductase n=1 Tax=Nocardioides imazamoxiresistens TaxID=3231893 RepID=A0ABU3PVV1_9ACTN|nr:SDR family NAD(P)-dependent oxidoreductase [Nocardioides zeae]MDT9593309.1 SDR family NAD(P)-dependent oxidoreductase [Nocardioides zeae]
MTRSALVTGAGSGIGRAVAVAAAARGFAVVATDVDGASLAALRDLAVARGWAIQVLAADVTVAAEVAAAVDLVVERHGRLDLLVNNAAVEATGLAWQTSEEQWRRLLDVNVLGVVNGLSAAVPRMLDQPGPAGTIVNVASLAAVASGPARQAAYNASKHAVLALTECLRLDLDEVGSRIGVHVVLPGPVDTAIFDTASAADPEADEYREVLRRYVRDEGLSADDAAEAIFEGVEEGRFWITTHPAMFTAFAERRAALLTTRQRPVARPLDAGPGPADGEASSS